VHSFLVICGNKASFVLNELPKKKNPFRQHQVVHPKDLKAYIKKKCFIHPS